MLLNNVVKWSSLLTNRGTEYDVIGFRKGTWKLNLVCYSVSSSISSWSIAAMPGKSFRRALLKFFRLRKVSSETRLNLDQGSAVPTSQNVMTTSANNLHAVVTRGQSHGAVGTDYEHGYIENNNYESTYNELDEKLNAAKSIRLAQQAVWYWGPINASVAESVLEHEPDGTFLVRDSTDDNFLFSLSCKYDGKVGHIRIEYSKGTFMFRKILHYKADNIKDFIETAVEHSRTGKMHFMTRPRAGIGATRILLLYPLSRRRTVQSLQHLARFVILQNVRRDDVAELPIPLTMKKYLRQPQYFVEFPK